MKFRTRFGWFRFVIVCLAGMSLFACSSKENKIDAAMQPSPSPASEVPPAQVTSSPTPSSDLEMIHFDFDSYALSKKARKTLKADAAWLRKHLSENIEIEGHCDERGTARYNQKLGEKRAKVVKNYFVKLGIRSSRLKVVSYGYDRPLDPGHDEQSWAQNRRAVPMISNKTLSQAD